VKALRVLARVLGALLLVLWVGWTALTLYYSNLRQEWLRTLLAVGYVAGFAAVALRVRPRAKGLLLSLAGSGLVALAYLLLRPSNDRDWLPDVAVTATAEIEGDRVTIRGVRNFRYRSETDFDERWEERTYDLSRLRTLDLFMVFWGPVEYCHTILSFGFEGGETLAASVEVRKERGEGFSSFGGFFKRFELIYVFADERDVIGVRAIHRRENAYLYRLRVEPRRLRDLFLSYARFANELAQRPQFYDTLENSCGVNILKRLAETGRIVVKTRDALLNGYWDRRLYDAGVIDRTLPFERLRALSRIDERARAAGDSTDFSRRIREGLPGPPPFDSR
jgi:uncharacterized protein DUF4105